MKFFNIGKANGEIDAANSAINPLLAADKITSIKVAGVDVPASDAPLADKINAYGALRASMKGNTQEMSELLATNGQVAAQVEKLTADNATMTASNGSLVQKNNEQAAQISTLTASVATLTAKNTEQANLLNASNAEAARLARDLNAINSEVSRLCLDYGCLDLTSEDGKPLAKDASDDDRLAAANRISIPDKLKASKGAVNSAMAKTGVSFASIPTAMPSAAAGDPKKMTATERCRQAVIKAGGPAAIQAAHR